MGTQDPANPAWTHAQNAYICAWRDRGRGEDVRSGTPENTPHGNDPRSQGQWKGAVTMTVPRGALCGPVNRPSSVGVLTRGRGSHNHAQQPARRRGGHSAQFHTLQVRSRQSDPMAMEVRKVPALTGRARGLATCCSWVLLCVQGVRCIRHSGRAAQQVERL